MASAPSLTAIISDSLDLSVSKETSQQQNGESRIAEPANSAISVSLTNKTSTENPRLSNGSTQEPASETKQDHINTGEKRDLEATSSEQTSAEAPTEPNTKKLKTGNNVSDAIDGTPIQAPIGQSEPNQVAPAKKKGGRPRKIKETVAAKKDIPTDGIGSRTRSRTKVVS
ncbi:uncharacterized protein BDV14DRAFT_195841 [Aspergillus stella-maris]|uniref:uncharacterized protein n=1 Tax=Aspergillus stella-maris TaxID=1810926 RepID=UPI003CCD80DC